MPNPFPGMNPYMEKPAKWKGVHGHMIAVMMAAINKKLPRRYFATIEDRLVIEEPEKDYFPDVAVMDRGPQPHTNGSSSYGSAVAVADAPAEVFVEETTQKYVEIREVGTERPVAVIELLSPSNKTGEGREDYRKKQAALRDSDVHLLEIDLLRAGKHTLMVPRDRMGRRPYHYAVCLHRAGRRGHFEVWTSHLRERLPRVLVPLLEGDEDIVLDIGAALNECYEVGLFDRRIDYSTEPEPPLDEEDAIWADELLRAAGRRE